MDAVPAWFAIVTAALGIAIGIFGSQATLGNKVTRALTLLEEMARRVTLLEARPHFHRRFDDPPEGPS